MENNFNDTSDIIADSSVYCPKCDATVSEYCSYHGPQLILPDSEIKINSSSVPYAVLTIPHMFLHIAPSIIPGAGLGVFSSRTIPCGVRFGPYRGKRRYDMNSTYSWQVYSSKKPSYVIDAKDESVSNWMRYINCSRDVHEQNLVAYQYRGQIFYRTVKVIPRFTELLVFYGSEFAHQLEIDLIIYNKGRSSSGLEQTKIDNKKIYDKEENPLEKILTNNIKPITLLSDLQNATKENYIYPNNYEYISDDGNTVHKCDRDLKNEFNVSNQCAHSIPDTTKKVFTCQICKKSFYKKSSLTRHKLVHLDKKLHNCTYCDFKTNHAKNLIDHINCQHTKDNIYQCEVCNKEYYTKRSFRNHQRNHLNEKSIGEIS